MTLEEFLAARLNEDEIRAKAALDEWDDEVARYEWEDLPADSYAHARNHDPARVLREVTAKRMLIAAVLRYETIIDGEWGDGHEEDEIAAGLCPEHQPDEMGALRHLAAVWSDHEDYDESWRP